MTSVLGPVSSLLGKQPAPTPQVGDPILIGGIADLLRNLLMALTHVLNNYGLAIIIFTIFIRAILTPLYLRQLRSQKRMQALSPRIKQLQQKYKGDRQALSKAQMALYKEEGVNPAAGCLPLLFQMPILYSMFYIFRQLAVTPHTGSTAIFHDQFLWFTLDKPDSIFGPFFLGVNAAWGPLPLLAGITQWIQSRMMMQPTSDPQQRTVQQIMQFMPLIIILFAVNYASGLALYWVISTTYAIVMQYFITGWGQLLKSPFHIPHAAPPPSPPAEARAPRRRTVVAPRTNARTNGNGRVSGDGTDAPAETTTVVAEDGQAVIEEGNGARLGKMQRAAMRPATTNRPRPRPKGAKR